MRRRPYFLGLWLDEAEHQRICDQCEISGLTASAHVRKLIMGSQILPRPPDELPKLLRQLSGIANNINQIAYHVNARRSATGEDIRELTALVWEAYRLIKDTL